MDSLDRNRRDPNMTAPRMRQLAEDMLKWSWRRGLDVTEVQVAELPEGPAYPSLADAGDAQFRPVTLPHRWPAGNRYYVLRLELACPDWPTDGGPVFLHGRAGGVGWNARNPQALVLVDGRAVGGLDTFHHLVRIADAPRPGHTWRIEMLVWSGMEDRPGEAEAFRISQLDAPCEAFAMDLMTAVRTADALDFEDYHRWALLNACEQAADALEIARPIGDDFYDSVPRAHAVWRDAVEAMDLPADRPSAVMVGHGHLDLGWLWPVAVSHFKGLHTVIQQLNLSDEMPEHKFLWSQPQSHDWIRRDHPDTWQRMQTKAESGNLVVQGGMWVESDTNVPCGESLIRQMLYGTRFVREHYGHEERLLWLPDVFGYSAALPQLLRQFGIEYFMTIKITWNEFNQFPHDTFHWHGIDGTSVLTHFGACRPSDDSRWISYNIDLSPEMLHRAWQCYQSKNVSDRFLMSFGYGDGGGGPTRPQVQYGTRIGRMPGLPAARIGHPLELFDELAEHADRYASWHGELYLELHRGTYTTESRTKRGNRLCEQALHDAELLASLAMNVGGAWDRDLLDRCWQRLLLLQFHDILPGSSIEQVYREAEADHAWILGLAGEVRDGAAELLAGKIDTAAAKRPLVLFNTAGHYRGDVVELPVDLADAEVSLMTGDGHLHPTQACSDPDGRKYRLGEVDGVPASGWAVVDVVDGAAGGENELVAEPGRLENRYWRIELNEAGRLTRLLDNRTGREVLPDGAQANQLQLLRDRPTNWAAWEVAGPDSQAIQMVLDADEVEVIESGPVRAALRMTYEFGRSRIVQDVRVHRDVERIDFDTWCDWHEHERLLKAAFPVDIHSDRATCEIQFGALDRPTRRNTAWDVARFEVCAQRWIDLSEAGYGVSLLNDCKYGHDVLNNVMRISLLHGAARSREPHNLTDQGEHRFCYSLLPHTGDWRESTVTAAVELNMPLLALAGAPGEGDLPGWFEFVRSHNRNFVISAVKKCEDDDRLLVRGYESQGGRGEVTLEFGRPVGGVWQSRADERTENGLDLVDDRYVKLPVRPFEVVTIKVAMT